MKKLNCVSTRFNFKTRSAINTAAAFSLSSLMLGAAILPGCASAPVPTEQFAISQTAIESATSSGADEYAPLDIKNARDKLASAQKASNEKNYAAAAALAEEASVDAKLAKTKAEAKKAEQSVNQLQENLRTLKEEMNRGQQLQSQQPASSS